MKALHVIFLLIVSQQLFAQTTTEKNYDSSIVKHLMVSNFVGDITVKESKDNRIQVKVLETRSKKEFSVEYLQKDDYTIVFLRTPCTKANEVINFDQSNPFGSLGQNNNENCEMNMDPFNDFPKLTIDIYVPKNVTIYLSTIQGEIEATNLESEIYVNNVNGNINLKDVYHVHEAKTVNGDIDISFAQIPSIDAVFTTINGYIEIKMDKNANFDASFKSMMGEMYTDFEDTKVQANTIKRISESNKISCSVGEYTVVQIGAGGTSLTMETINGNAYLKTL